MIKRTVLLFILGLTLFMVGLILMEPARAQDALPVLKVASGSCTKDSCSTYLTMHRQLNNMCGDSIKQEEAASSGSYASSTMLLDNQVNAAWMQMDVLFWRKRTMDLSKIQMLIPLFPEEIHFIAAKNSGLKTSGNIVGFGKDPITFKTWADLDGYRVGAVKESGAWVSAGLIKAEGGLKYELVTYASVDELKAALLKGEIQAMVLVGGQPVPAISAMGEEFKILSAPEKTMNDLREFYKPAKLNYPKVGALGTNSLAVESGIFVRQYKTPRMVAALAAFRACALKAIPELQEATGMHPKWQAVKAELPALPLWPLYELPAVARRPHP